ncbi:jg22170 [Pararge aegeria aegeria]|uniref:DNA repair nuclease/redox regulator APEX1 n=1 Tax=Pararge aegeria aegeria TaxID=348720 RepID=A0A8S4R153_9NEOP|nr:jg22170 [Pararge aegeria aegeria]
MGLIRRLHFKDLFELPSFLYILLNFLKKTADVKVSESDAPKKGRGKAKTIPEPEQDTESVDEKIVVTEKKNKRGKNIVNYNEDKDEIPATKKGRKKNVDPNIMENSRVCLTMFIFSVEANLTNPKTNKKNAGFTEEERTGMSELLGDGFVDTYRHFYPDKTGAYTFWSNMSNSRAKNVGWRLDYFIISERLVPALCDSVIRDKVYGSDHCPISLFLSLSSADKPKE